MENTWLFRLLTALLLLMLQACSTTPTFPGGDTNGGSGGVDINVPISDMKWIANQIYLNETSGDPNKIMIWSSKEEFLSLGIGHFIWYPAAQTGPYDDTFPALIDFMKGRNVRLPRWLATRNNITAPWVKREDYIKAKNDPEVRELRYFLLDTKEEQAEFILHRLQQSIPQVLSHAAPYERAGLEKKYQAVARTPNGMYPLIDYINFKGKGILATERYKGEGWGLLQVLQEMPTVQVGPQALQEFAYAAERVLRRRIKNSPPSRKESRWLKGWKARLDTYTVRSNYYRRRPEVNSDASTGNKAEDKVQDESVDTGAALETTPSESVATEENASTETTAAENKDASTKDK